MIPWCEPGLHRQVWGHAVPRGQGMGGVFTAGAAGMQAAVGADALILQVTVGRGSSQLA